MNKWTLKEWFWTLALYPFYWLATVLFIIVVMYLPIIAIMFVIWGPQWMW